jgi:hypothetical protein
MRYGGAFPAFPFQSVREPVTPLAELFALQSLPPDLPPVTATPEDVTAAASMIGWLSDVEERWIPVAAVKT